MYDPKTVIWEIRSPFKNKPDSLFSKGYRSSLITIWHNDPCRDGSDDSCGIFLRARHGNPEILRKIIKRYEYEWSSLFNDDGKPILSTIGTVINLFTLAAFEHFHHDNKRTDRFMRKNLYDIVLFSENTTDSLFHSINPSRNFESKRQDNINNLAYIIYGWLLRANRPWYKHPKFHVHHWKLQIHFWQKLRRRLFTRCAKCHKPFINETPITNEYETKKLRWFQSEDNVYHLQCMKDNEKNNKS